jgi:hypothetical protein
MRGESRGMENDRETMGRGDYGRKEKRPSDNQTARRPEDGMQEMRARDDK